MSLRDWVHRLDAECMAGLRGPDPDHDVVSTWRIVDLCRIARERSDVTYGEAGMLHLMKSLNLPWQTTRPSRPKADAEVQLWCQDKARLGQKGRRVRVWFERGVRDPKA